MRTANPGLDVQRLCHLSGISRATYYRHAASKGDAGLDHELQGAIQHICLKHKYYGYRRVTAKLRRQGYGVNAKRVLRLMRETIFWPSAASPSLPRLRPRPKPSSSCPI